MILLLASLRRLPILLGLLILLTVLPAMLVLGTQWLDWPELIWPPLHSGFLGEFEPAHFRAWMVDSYHEIRLTLGVDGFVIGGCLLFMWALWAVMICWITEDTYLLLRYGARQLREHGPDGARGWITALVTGTVLLGTASPSLATALPHKPVAASAPRHPGGPQHTPEVPSAAPETDGHHAPGPSVSGPTVFVHRGDSLWLLAKIHLGDGNRWHEITRLNPHLSPEPQYLLAGQWLRMPDDTVDTEPPPLPDGVRWVTVGNDDTLSGLAAQHLGDSQRWQEIFDLNYGRTQASNRTLRYAHVLMPGWRLALPPDNTTHPATQPPKPPSGAHKPVQPRPGPAPKAPVTLPAQPDRASPARSLSGPPLSPGVIAGLAAAGFVSAAVVMRYRFRLRHTPKTTDSPLPAVYPLPVAVHRTRLEPDTSSNDDLADEPPGEAAGPSVSAHRDEDSRAREATRTARPPALVTVSPSSGSDKHETEPESPPATATPASPRASRHVEPEAPAEHSARLRVTVFGQPRLHWHQPGQHSSSREVELQPRMRELLVYLALNPGGAGREEILEALWGEAVPGSNALNTTLSRLRGVLTRLDHDLGELVQAHRGHYRLNTTLATTDYHDFTTAVTTCRRATTDTQRAEAHETIIAVYQGDLADSIDTTWIEPVREHARRTYLDTITAHTRALAARDPQRALGILEHARDLAPFHEPLYRDIMRLQHTLDHTDDIARTLALLHSTLADIDTTPHPDTLLLAKQLQHPETR